MGFFSDALQSQVVQPVTRNATAITTVAEVTDSDEINNNCSVKYIDKEGKKRNRDNVTVRLYDNGSGYFPAVGDYVELQLEQDTCVIVARHISNYNMDVRSKMELQQDVYTDNHGADPGSSIA